MVQLVGERLAYTTVAYFISSVGWRKLIISYNGRIDVVTQSLRQNLRSGFETINLISPTLFAIPTCPLHIMSLYEITEDKSKVVPVYTMNVTSHNIMEHGTSHFQARQDKGMNGQMSKILLTSLTVSHSQNPLILIQFYEVSGFINEYTFPPLSLSTLRLETVLTSSRYMPYWGIKYPNNNYTVHGINSARL
jgi:hypothetical protein